MRNWKDIIYNLLTSSSELLALLEYSGGNDKKVYYISPDTDILYKMPCITYQIDTEKAGLTGDEVTKENRVSITFHIWSKKNTEDIKNKLVEIIESSYNSFWVGGGEYKDPEGIYHRILIFEMF